jgi:hypothetical protein
MTIRKPELDLAKKELKRLNYRLNARVKKYYEEEFSTDQKKQEKKWVKTTEKVEELERFYSIYEYFVNNKQIETFKNAQVICALMRIGKALS